MVRVVHDKTLSFLLLKSEFKNDFIMTVLEKDIEDLQIFKYFSIVIDFDYKLSHI